MNDGLPSDEQLRRIELGVQRRIDLRRRLVQRVAGGSVAALLVVGGFALLRPTMGTFGGSSGASGGGSGGSLSGAAAPAEGLEAVRCHGEVTTTVRVDAAGLPSSALTACAAAQRRTAVESDADAGHDRATASPTPSGAVLCLAADGGLSVWPGTVAVCRAEGLRPYPG